MTALAQNMAALAKAQRNRLAQAEVKASVKSDDYAGGLLRVTAVLRDTPRPEYGGMRVSALVMAVWHMEGRHMRTMLRSAGIWSEDRKLRELTDRQREALAFECELRAMRNV